ncbi:MAG: hypothetical protein JXB00_00135, partial [Bacteroidales bacterium]|nr:hypothetical protein [Bacteroidales bacterium]
FMALGFKTNKYNLYYCNSIKFVLMTDKAENWLLFTQPHWGNYISLNCKKILEWMAGRVKSQQKG